MAAPASDPNNNKPTVLQGDLANLPAALQPLTKVKRWVIWRFEFDAKRRLWSKVPYQAVFWRELAKNDNPRTWATYQNALSAYHDRHADGIGYCLMEDDIAAADLDHCRDVVNGTVCPWATTLIESASDTYVEISVSGTGFRIWGSAEGAHVHRRFNLGADDQALELYRRAKRFSVVTGNPINNVSKLSNIDHLIDSALLKYGDGEPAEEFATGDATDDGVEQEQKDEQQQHKQQDTEAQRLTEDQVDEIIRDGVPQGKRSEMFQKIVWWLAAHHCRVRDIYERLSAAPNGIAAKYQGRLKQEIERCYGKWLNLRRTRAAGRPIPQIGTWPEIECIPGEIARMTVETEAALLKWQGLHYYQRGERIVQPMRTRFLTTVEHEDGSREERQAIAWSLREISEPELAKSIACAARCLAFDRRGNYWRQIDPPTSVISIYFHSAQRRLPTIAGIVSAPYLRGDGSLVVNEGYDTRTGMLFLTASEIFPPIPDNPTLADAKAALILLRECIATFPFASTDDEAVVLSGILSALDRRVLQNIPLHAISSPKQGAGKTMLCDIIATIATGHLAPTIAPGRSDEELDKRFDAMMLSGVGVILIDNVIRPLESAAISTSLTHDDFCARVLGESRNVVVPADVLIMATGNNLVLRGDLQRRSLEARIDPGVENPEQREFEFNALVRVRHRRPELVSAALILQRAFLASGDRIAGLKPMGSFEVWSRRVREALLWAGAGDPYATNATIKEHDIEDQVFDRLLVGWQAHIGLSQAITVKELISYAAPHPTVWDCLLEVAANRQRDAVEPQRLGIWLNAYRDRMSGRLRLIKAGQDRYSKVALWSVIHV